MKCPTCGHKMVLLFTSYACDVCKPPQGESKTKGRYKYYSIVSPDYKQVRYRALYQTIKEACLMREDVYFSCSVKPPIHEVWSDTPITETFWGCFDPDYIGEDPQHILTLGDKVG